MSKSIVYVILVVLFLVVLFLFSNRNNKEHLQDTQARARSNVVNVYSARKEELIKDIFNEFTRRYNIKVNYIIDDPNKLIARILNEGRNSPADVFLTADVANLILAEKDGLLQEIHSEILENSIPESLRDGYWFALTKRIRLIVYAKDRVDPSELSDYEDLADLKWRDRILMRSSNHTYNQSLLASIIAADGEDEARKWVRGIVRNLARPPYGGDTDQIRSVAAGEGDVAIVNSYYVARILSSKNSNDERIASRIAVFFPNQNNRGSMVNISGAGVLKNSKNKENAQLLLEFMVSPEAQLMYTKSNFEYPILDSVELSEVIKSWGSPKIDTRSLRDMMECMNLAIKISDEEGWK